MWLSKEQKREYQNINERCIGKRFYCLRDGTTGYYATCCGVVDHEYLEMKRNDGRVCIVSIWEVRDVSEDMDLQEV